MTLPQTKTPTEEKNFVSEDKDLRVTLKVIYAQYTVVQNYCLTCLPPKRTMLSLAEKYHSFIHSFFNMFGKMHFSDTWLLNAF